MKKILFLIIAIILNAKDLNFIIGKPMIDRGVNEIIKLAIDKGYSAQITDISNRIIENDKSIAIKYLNTEIFNYNKYSQYKIADTTAENDIESFIKKVNQSFSQSAQKIQTKKITLHNMKFNFNFSKSDLKKMNKKTIQENNFDEQFKSILLNIKNYYQCKDKVCMSFYNYIPKNRKYYITKVYKEKPDLFFYEKINPYKKGRRYFMDIIIYVIGIDKDGEPSFEYQTIKNFEWLRNYRFISAQTGMTIRELINKKTGVDIR